MYEIKADYEATGTWDYLYYQGDSDYVAYDVKCELVIGDSGSLALSVPKGNPGYGRIRTRKTLLDFRHDGRSLGVFEVREISRDMRGTAEVYAVGEMAWLFDSVQPQREYHNQTARQFLNSLIAVHNTQCPDHRFTVGMVDVTDSNDSLYRFTNREQTLDCIRDKLVKRLGGNLRVRHVDSVRYLDYVGDQTYGTEAEQTLRFGENLLDYADNFSVEDICTELVPLGERLDNDSGDNSTIGNLEKRLTIEGVNGGKDYITNTKLVERFGHIRTTRTWDDVTVPANLLAKARAWLDTEQYERMHIKVKAVDLSMSDTQFGELRMGDYAYVICEPFGLKVSYPIRKRTYNPDNPDSDEIELGDTVRTGSYVASQVKASSETAVRASEGEHVQAEWLKSSIQNVTAMMTGARGGYKLTEYDEEGRWLADYIMDSMDKATAKVVRKVTVDGTAYSTNGINGPYETAILANGTILGKYIEAHSVTAEQISTDYTSRWEDADAKTLNTTRTELKAAKDEISASVTKVSKDVAGVRTDLTAEMKVRAEQISSTVKKGQIGSAINQSAEKITIKANKFGWESTNSSMTTEGILTAKKAVLSEATVKGRFVAGNESGMRTEINGNSIFFHNKNNSLRGEISPYLGGVSISTGQTLRVLAKEIVVDVKKASGGMDEEETWGFTGTVNPAGMRLKFINGFFIGLV